MCLEGQPLEEAIELIKVLRILGADQQVNIDPLAFDRAQGEAHLDVWENQLARREPAFGLRVAYTLIGFGAVVVRHADGTDRG
jgi:hypothetical protein